jgi:uncharacterized protein YacL
MSTDTCRNSPAIPIIAGIIGVIYLLVGWAGDQLTFGFVGLGMMLFTGVALAISGRHSETVKGLLNRNDERINAIDMRATAFAGIAIIVATLIAFVVSVAQGHSGYPYYLLAAIAGVSYIAAVVVLRIRG